MIQRIRDTGDELILYNDQHELLRVTGPTRLLGAAYGGVHVLPGGLLVVAGIVSQRLVVEPGGSCYGTGYVGVVPKVAEGGLLDVSGHLDPARWPEAAVGGTILIAAGTRYKKHVVTADGTLVPSTRPSWQKSMTARLDSASSEAAPRRSSKAGSNLLCSSSVTAWANAQQHSLLFANLQGQSPNAL